DAVPGAADDLLVRQPDRLVPTADPRAVVLRLPEDIEAVHAGLADPGLVHHVEGRAVQRPGAARSDHLEVIAGQRVGDGAELRGRDGGLQVAVLARLAAAEQVEGPAPRDAPGHADAGQQPGDVLGPPRIPRRIGYLGPAGRNLLVRHPLCLP